MPTNNTSIASNKQQRIYLITALSGVDICGGGDEGKEEEQQQQQQPERVLNMLVEQLELHRRDKEIANAIRNTLGILSHQPGIREKVVGILCERIQTNTMAWERDHWERILACLPFQDQILQNASKVRILSHPYIYLPSRPLMNTTTPTIK